MLDYDFSKAETIVSIGAFDFWLTGKVEVYEAGYAKSRVPKNGKMSKHIQFESNMTLTGNADKRYMVKPSEQVQVLLNIYNAITDGGSAKETSVNEGIEQAVKQLKAAGTKGVLVTGIKDKNAQLLALAINKALNSEVIDIVATKNIRKGSDAKVAELLANMKAGKVGALITNNTNPVYTLPNGAEFAEALKKVSLSIAFATTEDESASAAQYVVAVPHYLEAWGDVSIKKGEFGLMQPTIQPLFNTSSISRYSIKWMKSTIVL
ncbi:MAG: hypothetical protein R2821_03695 [Flavobacteriaceae bacterium]